MRKVPLVKNEYYHIYNRGVDKRKIFDSKSDIWRFIKGVLIFNRKEPVGSIRDELGRKDARGSTSGFDMTNYAKLIEESGELVEFVAICLNPNHFHFLVKQISDDGISKFQQRLGTGYTVYFNVKNNRSGSLFQGKFKAVHIKNNEQLLYASAYINRNHEIHGIKEDDLDLVFSSWDEYAGKNKVMNMCKGKEIILDQFKNFEDYEKFAKEVVESAKQLKKEKD